MPKKKKDTSRHPTVEAIARRLGISAMTVSRALNNRPNVNEKTRERVLAVANKFGYIPNYIARGLAIRKTETIGVVVPEITHSFFPEVIRGIEDAVYAAGYHLILAHSAEDADRERDAINTLQSKRVDGLLISTAQTVTDHVIYEETMQRGVPIVFFDRIVRNIGASCVSIDDDSCCAMITEHLAGHGYRRIAHLSGSTAVSIGKERLNGFRKALKSNGLEFRSELLVQSGFQENGGYAAMKTLLQLSPKNRPEAVVAVNDPAAFGAMKAILEHGLRIPEDIAIVGMSDDVRAELVATPLTTIRQPAYEIGKTAAATLVSEIEGKSKPGERVIVDTELIVRRSCGCGTL